MSSLKLPAHPAAIQRDYLVSLRLSLNCVTDFFLVFCPKYVNYYNSHRFMDLRRGLAGAILTGISPARRRRRKRFR